MLAVIHQSMISHGEDKGDKVTRRNQIDFIIAWSFLLDILSKATTPLDRHHTAKPRDFIYEDTLSEYLRGLRMAMIVYPKLMLCSSTYMIIHDACGFFSMLANVR